LTNDFSIIRASEYPLHVQVLASLLVAIMSSSLLLTLLRGRFLHIACVRRLDASLTDCWQYVTGTDASQGQGRRSSSKAAFVADPDLDYATLTSGDLSSEHNDGQSSIHSAFAEHALALSPASAAGGAGDDIPMREQGSSSARLLSRGVTEAQTESADFLEPEPDHQYRRLD